MPKVKPTFKLISLGTAGSEVAEVCDWLARVGLIEKKQTYFDEKVEFAVRKFQQDRGLSVDGIVGPETFRRLEEARWLLGDRVLSYTPGHLIHGDDVATLQRKLNDLGFDSGKIDGIFGIRTFSALQELQKGIGISSDGICGLEVFKAFARLTRAVTGGSPEELRDSLKHEFKKTGIANKVILIDSQFVKKDFVSNELQVAEVEILLDIARRLEGKLAALGTTTLVTKSNEYQDEMARAQYANQSKVDLIISLHLDALASEFARGCATFYFGNEPQGNRSLVGGQLAELIQTKLCQIPQIVDCGVHPKTWDLLRLTRMPAVKIALGYLTNREDAANFTNQDFRDQVAASISEATKEFFQPTVR